MAKYRNPWFKPMGHDPEFYSTDAKPLEYRGYLVYQRIKGVCWDFVKDGVCQRQMAGGGAYKQVIDAMADNNLGPHDHGAFLEAFNGARS